MSTGFVQRLRTVVDVIAAVAIIVVAAVFLWSRTARSDSTSSRTISLSGTFMKGAPSAKVGVVEYGDFECPACGQFARSTYPSLLANYVESGKVQFGFKHFPLSNHAMARPAAIAAICAGEQDRFWSFYVGAFDRTSKLDEAFLQTTMKPLAVDPARWENCRVSEAAAETVERDLREARLLGLRATPAFLIGTIDAQGQLRPTELLYGARPISHFDAAIARAEEAAVTGIYPKPSK